MSFNVMLAKEYDAKRVKNWWSTFIEPKIDGVRAIVTVDNKRNVKVYSRNGRQLDMFGHLNEQLVIYGTSLRREWGACFKDGVVLDGEMTGADFSDVAGAIHRKDATVETARFNPFIAIPLEVLQSGTDWHSQKYRLNQMWEANVPTPGARVAGNAADVRDIYKAMRKAGYEGAMVKDYSLPWVGKRSYTWMKMKEELSADLPIVGFKPGSGKYKGTLGALIVSYKGKEVPVSGMNDEQRGHMWANKALYEGKLCEVVYQEETVHGSLRHPRFIRMRHDKT